MFTSVQGVLSLLLAVQGKYWCLWPLQFPVCGWELSRGRFSSLLPRGSVEGGGYLEMLVENIPVLFNCLAWWVLCAGHLSSQGCSQAWQCIPFLLGRLWAVLQFLSCVAWGEGGRRSHSVQCKYSLRAEGQDLLCKLLIIPHLQTPVVLYYSPDCYGLLQSFLNDLFCVVWPLAEQVFSLVWLWSEYFCSMAASSA